MFDRMQRMYQRAYQEVEAVGDQVGPRSPEVIYFPFEVAVMTGVLVTGHEDQYLVLFGAEGEPFLTIRQDGRVMNRPVIEPESARADCAGVTLTWLTQPILTRCQVDHPGLHGTEPGMALRRIVTPLPGRGRSHVDCLLLSRQCECYRDRDGNKVDAEFIDRILADNVLGDEGMGVA